MLDCVFNKIIKRIIAEQILVELQSQMATIASEQQLTVSHAGHVRQNM
jgi:hypothetical protein